MGRPFGEGAGSRGGLPPLPGIARSTKPSERAPAPGGAGDALCDGPVNLADSCVTTAAMTSSRSLQQLFECFTPVLPASALPTLPQPQPLNVNGPADALQPSSALLIRPEP